MVDEQTTLQIMGIAAPVATSFLCGLLMLLAYFNEKNTDKRQLALWMAIVYLFSVLTWISVGLFLLTPHLFVHVHFIALWTGLMTHVLIYRIVFQLTVTSKAESFPLLHYFIPLFLCITMAIWSLFVPFDIQLSIVERNETIPSYYKVYAIFFTSKVPLFLVYNLFYPLKGLIRIRRYRRAVVEYSADELHSSVRWLYIMLVITLASIPLTLGFFVPIAFVHSSLAFIPLVITMLQDILFAYNLFAFNYVLIYPSEEENKSQKKEDEQKTAITQKLDKKSFEQYIYHSRPFLNPQLRITDLTSVFKTNRTYISSFINNQYGMNFSNYINTLRLEEFKNLRNNPNNSHLNEKELAIAAGFGSHRIYKRYVKKENI